MAIPVGNSPDKVEKPIAPPRTWKVTTIMTDNPGERETYLTKEQIINAAMYATRVHGLHVVTMNAIVSEPSLGRKAHLKEEKEK
jgi:hypothetical protein